MVNNLTKRFQRLLPQGIDFCSLRYVTEQVEQLTVRQNVLEPPISAQNIGLMVMVTEKGGLGYAATCDVSDDGLRWAIEEARQWAQRTQQCSVADFSQINMPHTQGHYRSAVTQDWESQSLADKIAWLQQESEQSKIDNHIVDWYAALWSVRTEHTYLTSHGGEVYQQQQFLIPDLRVTANQGVDTQYRSLGGYGRQGGLEILEQIEFKGKGRQLAEEALQLLAAPNCPTARMDVVLAPDQMMLQIHESIGHPLELDRILGDERNYAGTSFVTLDLFGNYQYGSPLLNVTYDPTYREQLASYAFDDEGLAAEKMYIIQDGILLRPLGGLVSQTRAGIAGVANSRATTWNRPPIDRMANLNVEPGDSSFAELISSVERGIFMKTNLSWSIDDSRNKFQFGCEWGQLIENGQLTQIVKNPNYRGISATFWRNLKKVGNRSTFEILGVPYCGKGEPNQIIRVGHAAPACLFSDVEVFGGM